MKDLPFELITTILDCLSYYKKRKCFNVSKLLLIMKRLTRNTFVKSPSALIDYSGTLDCLSIKTSYLKLNLHNTTSQIFDFGKFINLVNCNIDGTLLREKYDIVSFPKSLNTLMMDQSYSSRESEIPFLPKNIANVTLNNMQLSKLSQSVKKLHLHMRYQDNGYVGFASSSRGRELATPADSLSSLRPDNIKDIPTSIKWLKIYGQGKNVIVIPEHVINLQTKDVRVIVVHDKIQKMRIINQNNTQFSIINRIPNDIIHLRLYGNISITGKTNLPDQKLDQLSSLVLPQDLFNELFDKISNVQYLKINRLTIDCKLNLRFFDKLKYIDIQKNFDKTHYEINMDNLPPSLEILSTSRINLIGSYPKNLKTLITSSLSLSKSLLNVTKFVIREDVDSQIGLNFDKLSINLSSITYLSLSRIHVKSLPPSLTHLRLFNCKHISDLPVELISLKMNYCNFKIDQLPAKLKHLEYIYESPCIILPMLPKTLLSLIINYQRFNRLIESKTYNRKLILPKNLRKLVLPKKYNRTLKLPQSLKYVKIPEKYYKQIPRSCWIASIY